MFISGTRLKLRSVWYLLPFFRLNTKSTRQVREAAGYVTGKLLVDKGLTFWTATAWESEAAMKAYRGSGAHAEAMRKLPGWCSEASVVHWEQDEPALPGWDAIWHQMTEKGRSSKVDRPSANHLARRIPEPATQAWRTGPPLTPVRRSG